MTGPAPRTSTSSIPAGMLLIAVGGSLDAYTYLAHDRVFANAQTGNVVFLALGAAAGDVSVAVRHAVPIAAFVLGVLTARLLRAPRVAAVVRFPLVGALVLEAVVLGGVGVLPASVPSTVSVVLVAYVAAVQIAVFRTLGEWSYASIAVTGNLRTTVEALYTAVRARDRAAARQAAIFGGVVLAFAAGAVLGALATGWLGTRASWAIGVALLLPLALVVAEDRRERAGNDEAP